MLKIKTSGFWKLEVKLQRYSAENKRFVRRSKYRQVMIQKTGIFETFLGQDFKFAPRWW